MNKEKKIWILFNPRSGNRFTTSRILKKIKHFTSTKKNERFKLFILEDQTTTQDLIKLARSSGIKKLLVCGGDGTVRSVAGEILHSDMAMCIFPIGSGNGVAKEIGTTDNILYLLNHFDEGEWLTVDAGWCNNQIFLSTCGLGFDALVADTFDRLPFRGLPGYVWSVSRMMPRIENYEFWVYFNGVKLKKYGLFLTIANFNHFGNGFYISKDALPDDGFLNLVHIKYLPFYQWYKLFRIMQNRQFELLQDNYSELKIKEVEIKSQFDFVHLDGEPYHTGKEIQIKVIPKCLNLWVVRKKSK